VQGSEGAALIPAQSREHPTSTSTEVANVTVAGSDDDDNDTSSSAVLSRQLRVLGDIWRDSIQLLVERHGIEVATSAGLKLGLGVGAEQMHWWRDECEWLWCAAAVLLAAAEPMGSCTVVALCCILRSRPLRWYRMWFPAPRRRMGEFRASGRDWRGDGASVIPAATTKRSSSVGL
jgi:hypothetical protein